jgi:hypothetical protein
MKSILRRPNAHPSTSAHRHERASVERWTLARRSTDCALDSRHMIISPQPYRSADIASMAGGWRLAVTPGELSSRCAGPGGPGLGALSALPALVSLRLRGVQLGFMGVQLGSEALDPVRRLPQAVREPALAGGAVRRGRFSRGLGACRRTPGGPVMPGSPEPTTERGGSWRRVAPSHPISGPQKSTVIGTILLLQFRRVSAERSLNPSAS